jgi:hypothetical protein
MSKRDPVTHRTPEQMKKLSRGYNAKPEQVKNRVERNKARDMLMKEGRVQKGDGKDVDHKKPLRHGGGNSKSNLRVVSKNRNRGWRDGV